LGYGKLFEQHEIQTFNAVSLRLVAQTRFGYCAKKLLGVLPHKHDVMINSSKATCVISAVCVLPGGTAKREGARGLPLSPMPLV